MSTTDTPNQSTSGDPLVPEIVEQLVLRDGDPKPWTIETPTPDTERDERLRGIQERTEEARDLLPPESIDYGPTDDYLAHLTDDADYLLVEVTRLDAVVTAVREVHQPEQVDCVTMACALGDCTDVHPDDDDCPTTTIAVCTECDRIAKEVHATWDDTDVLQIAVPYPCPTVRALDGGAS